MFQKIFNIIDDCNNGGIDMVVDKQESDIEESIQILNVFVNEVNDEDKKLIDQFKAILISVISLYSAAEEYSEESCNIEEEIFEIEEEIIFMLERYGK